MQQSDLDRLIGAMDKVYTFVMENHDRYSQPNDYGNGVKMNMAEIHTLSLIAANPGICVSDVSKMWNRTVSAASQNVNRLVRKGLVKKTKEHGNRKTVHLYATESGERLSAQHLEFDRRQLSEMAEQLLKKHTAAQLETFLSVIDTGLAIMEAADCEKIR